MGHYCHICERVRANERFTGKGHRAHVCKDCQRLPREERERIEAIADLAGFLFQSHISSKNVVRLNLLAESTDSEVAKLARLVREVAEVKSYKKKRSKFLAAERPDLVARLKEAGLWEALYPY